MGVGASARGSGRPGQGSGALLLPAPASKAVFRHSWRKGSVVHWSCVAKHSGSKVRLPGFTPYLPFSQTVAFNVDRCSLCLIHTSRRPSLLLGACGEEKTHSVVVSNDITESK